MVRLHLATHSCSAGCSRKHVHTGTDKGWCHLSVARRSPRKSAMTQRASNYFTRHHGPLHSDALDNLHVLSLLLLRHVAIFCPSKPLVTQNRTFQSASLPSDHGTPFIRVGWSKWSQSLTGHAHPLYLLIPTQLAHLRCRILVILQNPRCKQHIDRAHIEHGQYETSDLRRPSSHTES